MSKPIFTLFVDCKIKLIINMNKQLINEIKELLGPFAERWNDTTCWHDMEPNDSAFLGTIKTDVRFTKNCAELIKKLDKLTN